MSTKTILISSVLFGFSLFMAAGVCFADASAQFKQAEDYKKNKQYEQAEAIYQQIVTDFPYSNDALEAQKQLTILYIRQNNQPDADTALQQLLAGFYTHKDIPQAVHDIAYQYRLLQKYEKANQIDQYVVDNWPQSDYAVLGQMDLAKYYVNRGDDPNAEVACDKLLTNFSNNPLIARAVHDVAQHYRDSQKYEKANSLYQYVIDNWPKTEHALWAEADLIKSHLALGDDLNAEAAVDKLLANFTDNPLIARAVWDTAQLFRDLKKYQKANQLYLHVIENWPKAEHAMWAEADLIKSYLALGDGPNAEAAIDKLLANFTDNPLIVRAVWDTAHLYRGLKKYEKANQLYQHVVENWPESEHAIQSQADLIKSNIALGDDVAANAAVDGTPTLDAAEFHNDMLSNYDWFSNGLYDEDNDKNLGDDDKCVDLGNNVDFMYIAGHCWSGDDPTRIYAVDNTYGLKERGYADNLQVADVGTWARELDWLVLAACSTCNLDDDRPQRGKEWIGTMDDGGLTHAIMGYRYGAPGGTTPTTDVTIADEFVSALSNKTVKDAWIDTNYAHKNADSTKKFSPLNAVAIFRNVNVSDKVGPITTQYITRDCDEDNFMCYQIFWEAQEDYPYVNLSSVIKEHFSYIPE